MYPPRKFVVARQAENLPQNAFTRKLADLKKVPVNDFCDVEKEDTHELFINPEELIDIDAALYPESMKLYIEFKQKRLDSFFSGINIMRAENELLFEYNFSPDEEILYKTPLNFVRLYRLMIKEAKKEGLSSDYTTDLYSDSNTTYFYKVIPATGNLLRHFNTHAALIEKIYTEAKVQLIKEAKELNELPETEQPSAPPTN